jgi:Ser/Thr protein kinase RdoA (MazF antagonist)
VSLLQQAPRFALADAARLARDLYGLDAAASPLPSERDQNFFLVSKGDLGTGGLGDWGPFRYVLKIANAAEDRAMLEAQNAAMAHVASRMAICPRVLPTVAGETIGLAPGTAHFVRLVTYLEGVPLAEIGRRTPKLFESLGRAVGRLDAALVDFDHPAIHRDFHWDLAKAASVVDEHLPRIRDDGARALVDRLSTGALNAIRPRVAAFRRSAIHNDANDWNVLVSNPDSRTPNPESRTPNPEIVAIIDFGDMVHSWTVADPAVAVAYAVLDAADPLAMADAVVGGYHAEYPLRDEEAASVIPLAALRLCMSACIAAWQQQQRPDDEYLAVSQEPIRRTLPALAAILERRG